MQVSLPLSAVVNPGFHVAQAVTNYPERPIRLIVPAAAGGGQDIVSRTIAERLADQLGQTFVVGKRGGGDGTVGADLARQSPPDGYTMISMSASVLSATYNLR